MPVYDMKCPRCGKQSTEYDENKWQCLHCGNKFVYKEESPTYQSQTNVNIQGSSLFDVEPYDSGNERPYEELYLKRHPEKLEEARWEIRRRPLRGVIRLAGLLLAALSLFYGLAPLGKLFHGSPEVVPYLTFIRILFLGVSGSLFCLLFINNRAYEKHKRYYEKFIPELKNHKITMGWIALCPSCKEEHSRYRDSEKDHTSGPAHCTTCGKQFMLLKGKAHAIKM